MNAWHVYSAITGKYDMHKQHNEAREHAKTYTSRYLCYFEIMKWRQPKLHWACWALLPHHNIFLMQTHGLSASRKLLVRARIRPQKGGWHMYSAACRLKMHTRMKKTRKNHWGSPAFPSFNPDAPHLPQCHYLMQELKPHRKSQSVRTLLWHAIQETGSFTDEATKMQVWDTPLSEEKKKT